MITRASAITALSIAGMLIGPFSLGLLPVGQLTVPWFGHLLLFAGSALGVPIALGSVGTRGAYSTVTRLWSAFGAVAILLVSAGASAAAFAAGALASKPLPLLAITLGLGMFSGLAIVKLAIAKARPQTRA
jgi:hypothetical protein